MINGLMGQNIKYYGAYQLIYVACVVILTSIGAFFHFQLNHEMSIVESWLHNNRWEILILAKLISLFLINRWFQVNLYQLKTIREFIRDFVQWPEFRVIVISVFSTIGYLTVGGVIPASQNYGYWYYHFASFVGLFFFFGIEFIVIAYLDDVLNQKNRPSHFALSVAYIFLFGLANKMSIPDYYGLFSYIIFCYSSLIYLSGQRFKVWSNVVCFLLIFVSPLGAFFGLDPVWGEDFSLFRVKERLNIIFLLLVWLISFCYYNYRNQFMISVRKLLR